MQCYNQLNLLDLVPTDFKQGDYVTCPAGTIRGKNMAIRYTAKDFDVVKLPQPNGCTRVDFRWTWDSWQTAASIVVPSGQNVDAAIAQWSMTRG